MRKIQGFILFVMLLFMQIISLLGLYTLNAVRLQSQADRLERQQQLFLTPVRAIMNQLSQPDFWPQSCQMAFIFPEMLMSKTFHWEEVGCSGNYGKNPYYYVIERLAVDQCILSEGMPHEGVYYRVSLNFLTKNKQTPNIIQQQTVLLIKKTSVCHEELHLAKPGVQMIRRLF